jgi:hypothetical protein
MALPRVALANCPAGDSAAAKRAFEDATEHLQKYKESKKKAFSDPRIGTDKESLEAACSAFQQSLAFQPRAGTAIHGARCLEELEEAVSARDMLLEARRLMANGCYNPESRATIEEMRSRLREGLERLKERLGHVRISVRSADRRQFSVSVAGHPEPSITEEFVPVGPGTHRIAIHAGECLAASRVHHIDEGAHHHLEIDVPADTCGGTPVSRSPRRTAGVLTIGAGAAVLAVAGALELHTQALIGDSRAHCDPEAVWACSPRGDELLSRAERAELAAQIVAGAGIALVAGGITLIVTAPQTSTGNAGVLPRGVAVRGTW